jgi:hypothetical protein
MKPFRLLLAVATLALTFLFTVWVPTATAAAKKPAAAAPPADTRKVIQSVNAAANTVVIENMRDKTTHTYAIDDVTALKVNNVPGKIADVKAGMVVSDFVERDDHTLDSISVTGYGSSSTPASTAAAPKKKK